MDVLMRTWHPTCAALPLRGVENKTQNKWLLMKNTARDQKLQLAKNSTTGK